MEKKMRRMLNVLMIAGMIAAMFCSGAVSEAGTTLSGSKFVSRIEKKQKSLMHKTQNNQKIRRMPKKRRGIVKRK